jgi:pullulanase
MTERCGAWQVGNDSTQGEIEFRIFFPGGVDPGISSIRVAGDFQATLGGTDWDFPGGLPLARDTSDPRGDFWTAQTTGALPAGFYQYKYFVEFGGAAPRMITDPCARYGGLRDQNSGVVVGGTQPADNIVRALPDGRKPLVDLNLYELMIDDFTAEYRGGRAPLDAVTDRLDDLRDLGVNAILFMPWTAWKNREFDWGYEPFQYFAVEARYANDLSGPEEKLSRLKGLVSACHDRGIHVIMDGVYNHVSLDFPYPQFYRDPATCPFTARTFVKAFPGLQDLDFGNACTGELIREVCRYWIDVFGIDGIRFDNTVNFYQAGDVRGLPEILTDVETRLAGRGEANFTLTLEHLDLSAVEVTNATAATSFWDNSLHEVCFRALWEDRADVRLLNALNNRRFLSADKVPTVYTSNHDHSHAAWQAGARSNRGAVGGWWKLQPFVVALYTSTAVPLLHNGQEFGEEHFLPEDDSGTGRRVTGRPLRWKLRGDHIGKTLTALHRTLARMRRDHPALRSPHMYPAVWEEWQTRPNPVGVGLDLERQLAIYHRWAHLPGGDVENFVVVLNFSDEEHQVEVPFPTPGRWEDLLAGFDGQSGSWSVDVRGPLALVPVSSHWGRVLWRLNPAP